MAVAPRLSLRSLVLLMSHGKPRLSSFFSSNSAAAPPPGNCAPAAPAVQPPADPVQQDSSRCKGPPHEEVPVHPIPDPAKKGNTVIGKSSPPTSEHPENGVLLPCAVDEEGHKHPTPDGSGSCSSCTPEPVPGAVRGNVVHPIPDPPPRRP